MRGLVSTGGSLHFIQPGKPGQRAFSERVNGKVQDECVTEHGFLTLHEVPVVLEAWRREDNEERTHSPSGNMPPREFIHNPQHRT
jgi:putative transposase